MKKILRPLYAVYEFLIAGPIFVLATLLTALVTAIGCWLGDRDWWGYWPAHIWSRFTCVLFLMRIEVKGRENIRQGESYVFVANQIGRASCRERV